MLVHWSVQVRLDFQEAACVGEPRHNWIIGSRGLSYMTFGGPFQLSNSGHSKEGTAPPLCFSSWLPDSLARYWGGCGGNRILNQVDFIRCKRTGLLLASFKCFRKVEAIFLPTVSPSPCHLENKSQMCAPSRCGAGVHRERGARRCLSNSPEKFARAKQLRFTPLSPKGDTRISRPACSPLHFRTV